MGLLVDRAFVDAATSIPAMREMIRDALIEALFTRNDRVLPRGLVAVLGGKPAITLKPKTDEEVGKIVRVANDQESTVSLGLPAEDYHYIRKQLSVNKDMDIGVYLRPTVLTTHPWIVPPQGGIEVDVSNLSKVEFDGPGNRALAGVGARWKAFHDDAARAGRLVPFFPLLPMDYAIGDALYGDAAFGSYSAPFGRYVFAVRSFASHGRRARIGFEEVANHGTGYDLLHLFQDSLAELVVPVSAAVALWPRPRAMKNVAYHFADAGALSNAVGKLSATGRGLLYANVYDASAWAIAHPGAVGGPFSLELGVAGAPSVVAAREKGLDAALAGFTARTADVLSPYDVEPRAYARTAESISRLMVPGYVTLPWRVLPDVLQRLAGIAEVAAARLSVFGAARRTGAVTLAPAFGAPKEPLKVYGISRQVWDAVRAIPGAVYDSRLAALWSEDKGYRARIAILESLKDQVDSARVTEPTVALR